ncbi:Sugar transporter ERD6-like 4, partial [Geodia barretti]
MPPDSPNPASPHRIRRNGDGERQWSVVLSCSVVTLLCLTSGVTIAIPSNVFLDLAQKDSPHRLTIFQQSVFAALASAGAVVGGLAGGWVADRWGRKCSLMFTGVPVLVGYLFISYAHFSPVTETFVILLYVGRLLTGIAMGSSSAVVGVCMKKCGEPEILVSHTSKAGADACLCQ